MSNESEWAGIQHHLLDGVDDVFMQILTLGQEGDDKTDAWSEFAADCKKRYEEGRAEHKDAASTWDEWSDSDFAKNIREELIDACIYAAQRNAKNIRSKP